MIINIILNLLRVDCRDAICAFNIWQLKNIIFLNISNLKMQIELINTRFDDKK